MCQAWLDVLGEHHERAVFDSYEYFLGQGDTFPPSVGQIAARAKIERFPLLGMNPMEHKLENTIFYRIYCAKYGNPPSRSLHGDVDDMEKWLNKYSKHMNESINKMKAASCERLQKYISQMTVNLEEFEKKKLKIEDQSEYDPDDNKPISKEAIEKLKASHPYLKAVFEGKPIPVDPDFETKCADNTKKYFAKIQKVQGYGRPMQQYYIKEMELDNNGKRLIYITQRTKYLRGEESKDPRTGLTRVYLD